jgi:hypothetical protein
MITFTKMKRYFYLLEIILLSSAGLKSQNVINTDRPDQSDGTHIVEKNHLQVETGVQFSQLDNVTKGVDNVTLIRYGVARIFEVRLLNQYSSVHDSNLISGIRPPALSFKNQLCKQHGLLPKLTLVSYFRLPFIISPGFPGDHFGYTFTLAARHDLSSKLKLYSNFGVTQDQQLADISYLGTVELNYNVTQSFSAFTEYYGSYAAHINPSNGLDIGFIYALKNNFAIDMAFGSPTMNLGINRFISIGVSARLPK